MNIIENPAGYAGLLEDPARFANLLFEELKKVPVPPQFVVIKTKEGFEQKMDTTFKDWGNVFGLIGSEHWHKLFSIL